MNIKRLIPKGEHLKSIYRILIYSFILTTTYAYLQGCGKKKTDLKKDLVDHKIISLSDNVSLSESGDNPFENNLKAIENGQKHYSTMCHVCHGDGARGSTGPDLLDNVWLHGSDNFSIYNIIMNGITLEHMKMNPPRGKMPGYRDILGPRKVLEVMAWLDSQKSRIIEDTDD